VHVLFVCSGNICRSPFTEELLRRTLARVGKKGILVSSAGTLGISGRPASGHSLTVGREHGIDLSSHRSRPLGAGALRKADLVVVMERAHHHLIEEEWPEEATKVRLLREYESGDGAGSPRDLFDPIGHPLEDYRTCASIMARCVENLARRLDPAG
jgi:protein-tyrosine-phosphatase